VAPSKKSEEYVLQFPLANISAPVLIENIFYDFNKATLRPESQKALDELVQLLPHKWKVQHPESIMTLTS
jgi:outer membrane protein OmpA-like peptidoglycan-associated protein